MTLLPWSDSHDAPTRHDVRRPTEPASRGGPDATTTDRLCPRCGRRTREPICPADGCQTLSRAAGESGAVVAGDLVDGRYMIEGLIGEGGFGAVYRARDAATGAEVALKVLRVGQSDDDAQIRRFYNETRAASALRHPNTVRVFDFGQTTSGLLFQAMEMLHGCTLAQRMGSVRPLDVAWTVRMAISVLASLEEAHGLGIVHRDLKPANIFLATGPDGHEQVKVIDFGIAKLLSTDPAAPASKGNAITRVGFPVGTPTYMSPEQVLTRPIDGRSDLYSLGVLLYRCVTGSVPFRADTPMATMLQHVNLAPEPLERRALSPLPRGLSEVVHRALAKSPDARFPDAASMRAALDGVLHGLDEGHDPGPQEPEGRDPTAPAPREPMPFGEVTTARAMGPGRESGGG